MRAMEAGTDGGNKNVNSTFGAKSTSEDGRNATTDGAHNENGNEYFECLAYFPNAPLRILERFAGPGSWETGRD